MERYPMMPARLIQQSIFQSMVTQNYQPPIFQWSTGNWQLLSQPTNSPYFKNTFENFNFGNTLSPADPRPSVIPSIFSHFRLPEPERTTADIHLPLANLFHKKFTCNGSFIYTREIGCARRDDETRLSTKMRFLFEITFSVSISSFHRPTQTYPYHVQNTRFHPLL